jgi:hypothetical protein
MMSDEDVAVRLTAISALRVCVDDFDFDLAAFFDFVEATILSSVKLIAETDEFDSKQTVLQCLTVVVERLEQKIAPYALHIINALAQLWPISEGQNMFRCSIVTLLTKLVVVDSFYFIFRRFELSLIKSNTLLSQLSKLLWIGTMYLLLANYF